MPNSLQAQEWAPVGAKWYYDATNEFTPRVNVKIFKSIKDTLIHGKNSKIVSGYYMYDSASQVYFYNTIGNNGWCLLYDFSKNTGDTIFYPCWDYGNIKCFIKIDSVGTVILNGISRKVQYTTMSDEYEQATLANNMFEGEMIEGVGRTNYMFPLGDFIYDGPLRCYFDSTIGLNKFNNFNYACDTVLFSNILSDTEKRISIYPIPGNSKLQISGIEKESHIKIMKLRGQVVYLQETDINTSIDIQSLNNGIYIIEIINSDQVIRKKFIKSN